MSEFKDMTVKDLVEKESQLREDIFRTRFKLATGDLEDTSSIRKMKKEVARIKTVLSQRLAENPEQQ
jgi:large subunit ribosomal protein L29